MKMKIITLLLVAAVSLPSMAQFKVKTRAHTTDERDAITLVHKAFPGKNSQNGKKATRTDIPEGYASVTLTAGNVWEDGTGYQMLLDADATAYGTIIPETGGLTTSGDASASTYAEFEYKIPENADGSLTTANIVFENSVSILIPAGTYDWCITNPTPGDRMWIASENGSIGGRADDFEFVEGVSYEFVVSLGGNNDQVDLNTVIEGVELSYNVDNITSNSADAVWTLEGEPNSLNLRYRKVNNVGYFNSFEDDADYEGLWPYDFDEDGYNWGIGENSDYLVAHSGNTFLYSQSWVSGTALTPDNWLILPEMDLSGKRLTFWACSFSELWLDNFGVYFLPADYEGSIVDLSSYTGVELNPNGSITAPGEWTEFTINLPDDLGVGSIFFRHYDCEDMYALCLDDVTIGEPFDPAEYAWVEVDGVTDNLYTMSGLDSGTEYEMQMQAYPMDWGESIFFTTLTTPIELANDGTENSDTISLYADQIVDVKLTGRTLFKDGKWNTICLPFDVTLEGSPLEGAIAKTLTDAEVTGTHVKLTFGAPVDVLEAGVPYIIKWEDGEDIVNPTFTNVLVLDISEDERIVSPIDEVKFIGYYNAFDITSANQNIYYMTANNTLKYTGVDRTLKACRAYFQFTEAAIGRQLLLDFGDGETTGIADLDMNVTNGNWYTVDGKKLDQQPSRKGVYINNGVKVVIK